MVYTVRCDIIQHLKLIPRLPGFYFASCYYIRKQQAKENALSAQSHTSKASGRCLAGRLTVTAAMTAAFLLAGTIPLPGVDYEAFRGMSGAPVDSHLRMLALGLLPVINAFVIIEIIALIIPRLRPLRISGPKRRKPLFVAVLILALPVAAVQACGIAAYLESVNAFGAPVVENPGWFFRLQVMITLVAAMYMLVCIAAVTSRHGLGNGFSVLIFVGIMHHLSYSLTYSYQAFNSGLLSPFSMMIGLAAYGAVVAVSCLVFLTQRKATSASVAVEMPTSGIIPIKLSLSVLLFPATLASFGVPVDRLARKLVPGTALYLWIEIILVVLLCAVLSFIFYYPKAVNAFASGLRGNAGGADSGAVGALKAAIPISVAFLCVILIADHVTVRLGLTPLGLSLVIATAIVLDLVSEAKAVSSMGRSAAAWEVHRLYALRPLRRALQEKGIESFARAANHRKLLYFFGPYIPVEIQVPSERAKEAQEIIEKTIHPH